MAVITKVFIDELKILIADGQTAKVITALRKCQIDNKDIAHLILQNASRFAKLEEQIYSGQLSFAESNIERNKITASLLTVIEQLSLRNTIKTEIRSDIYHLPDLQPHFIGREKELQIIDDAWANPKVNLLEFVAPGGTGKTMLITFWLHNRLPENHVERPDVIYAWSFYSQGSEEGRQSSSDFFFDALARFFEVELPKDPTERGRELARHLRKQRCLLILDGTEPLQYPLGTPGGMGGKLKDPSLTALLRELSFTQPGLCLLTTRVAIQNLEGIEAPMHIYHLLDNFDKIDGALLLKKLGVRGKLADLEAASEEYKGHALALRLLGNYLSDLLGGDVRQRDSVPHLTDDDKQGQHARRVMQAYVRWFEQAHHEIGGKGSPPELIFLRLMGLFDRPAPVEVLDVLAAPPAIKVLTDGLSDLPPERLRRAFEHLKKLGLLEENRLKSTNIPKKLLYLSALRELDSIDSHPLVREYFGQQLEAELPSAWREANTRIYHFYKNLPDKHQPDTLEEMEPLYTAMTFGARAGLHDEVLEEIYWDRINRNIPVYSVKKFGVFGTDLAGLATLFEVLWSQPSNNLNEANQVTVLSWAGFMMRGLGRLRESTDLMQTALYRRMNEKERQYPSTIASNLSELYGTLGALPKAVEFGKMAVEFADQSDDAFSKERDRTTLAVALYQSGQIADAEQLFIEAEAMQRKRYPEYHFLYSLLGYRYCDLLLSLGRWDEVLERAAAAIKIAEQKNLYQLTFAHDQLSIARAHAAAAHCEAVEQYFNTAVESLRKAGAIEFIVKGLLSRANWFLQTQRSAVALEDLNEVYEIAEDSGMGLYLIDWHIAMSRLRRMEGDTAGAEQHKAEALRKIKKTGYLLREREAESL